MCYQYYIAIPGHETSSSCWLSLALHESRFTRFFDNCLIQKFSAINATARAYVSKVTTLEERTTHVSLISLFQSMGFILGPAVQAALSPIGSGEPNPDPHISFNLFTATGSVRQMCKHNASEKVAFYVSLRTRSSSHGSRGSAIPCYISDGSAPLQVRFASSSSFPEYSSSTKMQGTISLVRSGQPRTDFHHQTRKIKIRKMGLPKRGSAATSFPWSRRRF